MINLSDLRDLVEAARANTSDGLAARERLVEEIGRLLDRADAHPARTRFDVEMFTGRAGTDPADHDLWIGAGAGGSGHYTVDTARGFRRLRRLDMPAYPPMRIVEIRTTCTVVETEEADR